MKIWVEKSYWFPAEDEHIKLAISWFKHGKRHLHKGLTVNFIFFEHMIIFNYVNNYKLYLESMEKCRFKPRKPRNKLTDPKDKGNI